MFVNEYPPEKRKLHIRKILWTFAIILTAVVSNFIFVLPEKTVKIVNDSATKTYYDALNSTSVDLQITFNYRVVQGYVTVSFFDENGEPLDTKSAEFYTYGRNATAYISTIRGDACRYTIDGFQIQQFVIESAAHIYVIVMVNVCVIVFAICAFMHSYKEYEYNGRRISVYTGWYHHYLKVDGVKMDEHNTLTSHVALVVSCTLDDGTSIQATISVMHRIALKINDKLYEGIKKD